MVRLAHRWPGFDDSRMRDLFDHAGLAPGAALAVPGPLEVRLWPAIRVPARAERTVETTP